ncbi:unannotated protein [freshwater metagenome]|uniref:Unannotated protein n=1 Tax=freshwater metagenome TaxID=449393 RepID=A0A6J6PV52_9ZZZZ
MGVKTAHTLVSPKVEGFHSHVAALDVTATLNEHSLIVRPFCKNSTIPFVPTATVIVVSV